MDEYQENASLQFAMSAIKNAGRAELQREVYAWLGIYRDLIPDQAVQGLQNILGKLEPAESYMNTKRQDVTAKTLQPGDKVKFVGDHPWCGEIGAYISMMSVPFGGSMHMFEVIGKAGIRAGANPNQFVRV